MDLGAWVLALAVLWAMRLARMTVQESVGLGWTPLNVSLGTSADVLGAQAPTTPDAAPNKLENALDREVTLQKAVATAQKISERARQEAEARERAAARAIEAARAEIERADRARRDEQARLAAEAQARAAREAELAAQARQRREEAAREAAAREQRTAAEAAQEAARRAERARLAALLLREREEAAQKARAGLWIATAVRLQARIEPAQAGDAVQASGLALPASHVVILSCALADKGAASVRVPLLERGQLRCLDWTEPGLAALGGDEPALAKHLETLCAAHAEGLRVSSDESSGGQATAPAVVTFVAGALAAARLLQELNANTGAGEEALIKSMLDRFLASKAAACETDSLSGPCAALLAALGPQHSLARVLDRLAEENASEDAKRARERAHEIGMRRLAERILEAGDEVGRSEASGALSANVSDPLVARLASEDRIRILKSTAQHLLDDCSETTSNGLSNSSADELLLARRFLEAALTLKRRLLGLGSLQHPALLPELLALDSALRADTRWCGDAAGLGALVLRVLLNLGEQFASAGRDPLSALLVVESAQRRFARALPLDHRELARAQRLSARLQHQLGASDLRRLQRVRRGTVGEPLLALLVSRLADDALAGKLGDGPCPGGDDPTWVELIGPLH
ncbi:hypothetical protein QBZ16_001704 [Prototheca wickerhamii]|uniref:Uncharacterized protein n=1 Tax=Prototheca wickerhamii TaxID=3111 RepID=A0AAD9IDX1_PROWI|nr:hypothetical protein QBZ16_001704 [Prototheca wickerhamii]